MSQKPEILNALRVAITSYHESMRYDAAARRHRDPFIDWYLNSFQAAGDPVGFRVLAILVNARFDQGTRAERALENTQRALASGILNRDPVALDEVPALNSRQRMKAEQWRQLFWASLPGLKALSTEVVEQGAWQAGELLLRISRAKVPYFGPKTARLAVRWISELVPEIRVDMSDSEVPVDSLVYRVTARLGLIDPPADRYWGPGSPAHRKIQDSARLLFPENPSLLDEPVWMMGRLRRNGGFCHPTTPSCGDGCLFAGFCPKLWPSSDPASEGYTTIKSKPAAGS